MNTVVINILELASILILPQRLERILTNIAPQLIASADNLTNTLDWAQGVLPFNKENQNRNNCKFFRR